MDKDTWLTALEKPIYSSLEEIFTKANLTGLEKKVYLDYMGICEYWLLRSKSMYHRSFDQNTPNFIKQLARVVYFLMSDQVTGKKKRKLQELFAKGSNIHRVYHTHNGKEVSEDSPLKNGTRVTQNSSILQNTFFELLILSFFVTNGFKVELRHSKKAGQKIPEFTAIKNNYKISVEAKKPDIDSTLDNIFGDSFTDTKIETRDDRKNGFEKIKSQIKQNYDNAIEKLVDIEPNEKYLIFISLYNLKRIGQPTQDYFNSLPETWKQQKYKNFLGLVIEDGERTYFLRNRNYNLETLNLLDQIGINSFHNYTPPEIK